MSEVSNTSLQDKLFDLFLYFGSEWVLELLVILSVISLVIAIERCLHFLLHRDKLAALRDELDGLLDKETLRLPKSASSHLAPMSLRSPSTASWSLNAGQQRLKRPCEAR